MAQIRVAFYNHRGNWSISDKVKEQITNIINEAKGEIDSADVYFMHQSTTKYETAHKKQLKIFFGATPGNATEENFFLTTNKGTYAVESFLVKSTDYATPIVSSNDQVVGFYSERHNEFYVPFAFDELDIDTTDDILLYIMEQFKVQVLDEYINKDSWMKSKQLDVLRAKVTEHLSKGKEYRLRELSSQVKDIEENIDRTRRQLKERYDSLLRYRKELEVEETMDISGLDNFIEGLDQIAQHPQVSNIMVKDDLITIYIDKVYAYAQVRGEERRYYIGNMHVKININNTDVKFFGDNPRRSVWSSHDPHPHVNGNDGRACLGNVSATIAELCSQKEIYPLFLVCLDFLENANTEDSAGKNVKNWDEVDEEGNVVSTREDHEVWCQYCEEYSDEEDMYTVYTDFNSNNGELLNPEQWCEGCRDNNASYVDGFEEIVSDDIYGDVSNWSEDQDGEDY